MKKMPALFIREERGKPKEQTGYTTQINPQCFWVFGLGVVATRKWDGTAVLVKDGQPWARFDAKNGKTPPEGFIPAQEPDRITGHWPGWVLATRPEDKWIREAFSDYLSANATVPDGTYEACGPKINSNKEKLDQHVLIPHGLILVEDVLPFPDFPGGPPAYNYLRSVLEPLDIEGIVFYGPGGLMAKCTKSGLKLPRLCEVKL